MKASDLRRTLYTSPVITSSTFIWDNCDHNCESIFGDTLRCINGIIVQRKEISSYARVGLTHEAVSAAENTTKMRAFRPLEKKATTTMLVKRKETESMARVALKDVRNEAPCSFQKENQPYQLLRYLSSLNPNKAGFFESSFFWAGVNLSPPPSYFKRNLSNINITLCNC